MLTYGMCKQGTSIPTNPFPTDQYKFMAIAIICPGRDTSILRTSLQGELPGVRILDYPYIPGPEDVEMIVIWKHPPHVTRDMPKLKLISSLGAGVDHILRDETLPSDVPIVRIVDPGLTIDMRRYLLLAILHFHKNMPELLLLKEQKKWAPNEHSTVPMRIGIMGLGVLGADIALTLHNLGFDVFGYSNNPRTLPGITCYSESANEKELFLSQINCLICLLPLTQQTKGILNRTLFQQMPQGSYLINVGRGSHLVEGDLIWALDRGIIKGAFLDVLQDEPPNDNHTFWEYPEIVMTPHIASITDQEAAARQIADNYRKLTKGDPLINQVDRIRGY